MPSKRTVKSQPLPFLALLLAWLVPGAGHMYIGRFRRGVIIFVLIGATFWAGVAIGGVMTMDYHNERWWFIAETFTGVHGLIGWQRQQNVYDRLTNDPEIGPKPRKNSRAEVSRQMLIDKKLSEENIILVAPVDTVARAYAGVAGLLNLMCIFDAVVLAMGAAGTAGEPGPQRPRPAKEPDVATP
ncbi:MAG: DUF6677 family protein [Planctomycetota bacterium]|nr:DUF6677 family protein [Planctomycetota bacterium]